MTLIEWVQANLTQEYGYLVMAIMLGILWMIVYDFYHLLFSAVLSWFKKS